MKIKYLVPLIGGASAAVALSLAPLAAAGTTANCDSNGGAKLCSRPGHVSIYTTPEVRGAQGSVLGGGWNPFGTGPFPPLIAMD